MTEETLAPLNANLPAVPGKLFEELAGHAVEAAKTEAPELSTISFRAGALSIDGNPVPGSSMECLVLAAAFENAYYPDAFDPDEPKSPACYALSIGGGSMAPFQGVESEQSEKCVGCEQAEWGSAPGKSRGKACKEIRRLIIMPAESLVSPESVLASSLGIAKVPVTSVKNWKNYVNGVAAYKRPYYSTTCKLICQPNPNTVLQVTFEPQAAVTDEDVMKAIMQRREQAVQMIMQPYAPNSEPEEEPTKGKKKKY
jgi:hypothetical protein